MLRKVIITVVLAISYFHALANGTSQEMLEKAYQIRNQDLAAFNSLLTELEQRELSETESDFLTYLQARRELMAGNEVFAIKLATMSTMSKSQRVMILSHLLLSDMYNIRFDLEQAFNHIFRALELSEGFEDNRLIATVYSGAANLYAEIEDFESASLLANEAISHSDSPTQRCFLYTTVGSGYRKIDTETFEIAVEACEQAQQKLFIYLLYLNHAKYLIEANQANKAYAFMKANIEDIAAQGFNSYTYSAYLLLGRSARRIGLNNEAEQHLLLSLKNINEDSGLQITYRELALLYTETGDIEKANQYFLLLDEVSDRVLASKLKNQLAYHAAKFNNLNRQHKIENLTRISELNEIKNKLNETKIELLVLVIVLISFLGATLVFVVYRKGERFKKQSYQDQLTGAYNRRWFDISLRELLLEAKSTKNCHCLIMIDLDEFKKINDVYGHLAGDKVLKVVSEKVKTLLRKGDIFARIGGEEFALILPNTSIETAHAIAEKYLSTIRRIRLSDELSDLRVTVSMGICSSLLAEFDFDKMVGRADQAMYLSKENGRNKVSTYTSENVSTP